MKKILLLSALVLFSYYYFIFVRGRKIKSLSELSIYIHGVNEISIQNTDSYFFMERVDMKYSAKKYTLFLEFTKSTMANIFYSEKLGYRVIKVDSAVKVLSYIGINKRIEQLPKYPGN